MSSRILVRCVLPGLVLMGAGSLAQAQEAGGCQDTTLVPTEQRAACDAEIEAATDPLEQARLLVLRAGTYRREENVEGADKALADLAEAERLVPDMDPELRVDLLVERSGAHYAQDDEEAALAAIEEAERLAPDDADVIINRSRTLAADGDLEGALAQFARARELEPDNVEALVWSMFYQYEASLFGASELEACVESGNKAVELAPGDARVWAARGLCLAELGRTEEALADIAEAERLGPYTMITHQDIIGAYHALERPDDALAAARRTVEFDPEHEDAQTAFMMALVETGAVDEAIAAYHEAQATGVEETPGHMANNLAWTLYNEGQPEKALPIMEEGLAKQTEPDAYSLDTHAHILAAVGRSDEAVEAFLRAAELGGSEFRSMYEEGLTRLGHAPEPGEEGFEAALRACAATGEACKLFPQ